MLVTRLPPFWSLPRSLPLRLRVRRLPLLLRQQKPTQRFLQAALCLRLGPRERGAVQRSVGVHANAAPPRPLGRSAPQQPRLLQGVLCQWSCSLSPRRRLRVGVRRLLQPRLSIAQPQHWCRQRAQRRRSRRSCLQLALAMRSSGNGVLQASCRRRKHGRSGSGSRGVEVPANTASVCCSGTTPANKTAVQRMGQLLQTQVGRPPPAGLPRRLAAHFVSLRGEGTRARASLGGIQVGGVKLA